MVQIHNKLHQHKNRVQMQQTTVSWLSLTISAEAIDYLVKYAELSQRLTGVTQPQIEFFVVLIIRKNYLIIDKIS